MQRAKGTDPAAEEPPEYYCQYNRSQRPQKRPIEGMGGQYCSDCHQGVELEEPVNRPAPQLRPFFPYGADDAKPNKHREEENLAYSSDCYYLHITCTLAYRGEYRFERFIVSSSGAGFFGFCKVRQLRWPEVQKTAAEGISRYHITACNQGICPS